MPVPWVARAADAFHARNGVVPGVVTPSRNQQKRPKTARAMDLFLQELFERGPNIVRETRKSSIRTVRGALLPGQGLDSQNQSMLPKTAPHSFTVHRCHEHIP